jgi:predicted metal-dependent RNase
VREFGWHEDLAVSGIQIGLLASGHIPGAAAVALADDQQMVVWGGDIGWDPRPGLPGIKGAPEWEGLAPAVVYLEGPLLDDEDVVSESAGFERLLHEAQLAIEHGGRLLVAAAGCGRAQSLLASVGKAMDEGKLPVQPVGVDRLTAAVADSWPSTIQCPRSVDHASATILIMSTRLMFPGTPSAAAATELADDPRSRIVIAGGVIEQTPAGNLLYGGAESRCAVSQIPFADRLTWRGLREFTDWVRPGRIEFVTAENAKHRYR